MEDLPVFEGVTLQGGSMIRTTDVAAMAVACAKRRKKKKRRKQRRPALGNTEDDEEEEYSSECDNGQLSSRLPWSVCSTTTTTVTTTTNRPLNPECQEFQFRSSTKPIASTLVVSDNAPTFDEITSINAYDQNTLSTLTDSTSRNDNVSHNESNGSLFSKAIDEDDDDDDEKAIENVESREDGDRLNSLVNPSQNNDLENETERLTSRVVDEKEETEEKISIKVDDETNSNIEFKSDTKNVEENRDSINPCANEECPEDVDKTAINPRVIHIENHTENHAEKTLSNGDVISERKQSDKSRSKEETKLNSLDDAVPFDNSCRASSTPKIDSLKSSINVDNEESCKNQDQTATTKSARRKYNAKGAKFVREPTPGPDLEESSSLANESGDKLLQNSEAKQTELEKDNYTNRNDSNLQVELQEPPQEQSRDLSMSSEKKISEETSDTLMPSETFDNSNEYNESKIANDTIVECSTEDSGFESQSRTLDYPITKAVTEWLERVNSPDIFISVSSDSESEDEDNEELNEKPPKNLQGNPMPALSANSGADNDISLSRTASCGEFARANNVEGNPVEETKRTSRKKKATKSVKRKAAERNARRTANNDTKLQKKSVPCIDSKTANQVSRKQHDVGDVCEFTEEDSTAGMRVATSSRMDSKRVNAKRTRKSGRNRELAENVDVKIRRITDAENEDDEGIVEDTVSVKTFEKGEIVVSVDGKLLPISSYEPILYNVGDTKSDSIENVHDIEIQTDIRDIKKDKNSNISEDENDSVIASLNSIEEPDVLECWEVETIEPVITPKRILQTRGVSYDGEAAEEDNIDDKARNIEHVQKYYRLARESTVSIEEDLNEKCAKESSVSCVVPNKCERMIESVCSEEIPIVIPNKQADVMKDEKIPVDEAFEAYESCYMGKTPYLNMDSNIFRPRRFYNQDGEGPIPCRAVCCNIQ